MVWRVLFVQNVILTTFICVNFSLLKEPFLSCKAVVTWPLVMLRDLHPNLTSFEAWTCCYTPHMINRITWLGLQCFATTPWLHSIYQNSLYVGSAAWARTRDLVVNSHPLLPTELQQNIVTKIIKILCGLHFMSCDPLVLRVVPSSVTISHWMARQDMNLHHQPFVDVILTAFTMAPRAGIEPTFGG